MARAPDRETGSPEWLALRGARPARLNGSGVRGTFARIAVPWSARLSSPALPGMRAAKRPETSITAPLKRVSYASLHGTTQKDAPKGRPLLFGYSAVRFEATLRLILSFIVIKDALDVTQKALSCRRGRFGRHAS